MKAASFFLSLLAIAVFTGCASMKVDTDYDNATGFASYETFAWMEKPDEVKDNLTRLGQITERIEAAVERELMADGYQKASTAPDFFVVYHTAVETQITGATIDTWGYNYRRPRWRTGTVYADVSVDSYQEGTLIIDIVDAEKNELVWRGTAVGAVSSPGQAAKKVDEAVQKILAEFPPHTRS